MSHPHPPLPGASGKVTAGDLLVLAPHFDDEVLGCGGLLLQRLAAGAAVRVLFLTDGGGGVEEIADREAYGERRRQEAEAVAEAMGTTLGFLDLPDGKLSFHLAEAADGIGAVLKERTPEAVLVPSPLEGSADHRAAFGALHRLLGGLRGGDDPLAEALREVEILVYEINRPAHPDLLLDVTSEVPKLAELMESYGSQQERHGYWRASLGLRRYRTLSLSPEVEAAEGYRRLALEDFVSRSPAQLLAHLGADRSRKAVTEGPAVSVIVRTKDRPELLAEALASLADSTYRNLRLVLVNDGGAAPEVPANFPFAVERIDLGRNRGRAAAANAGVAAADGDYVAFLDDDDLVAPEHYATLVAMVSAAEVRVAYTDAAVGVYELDPAEPGEPGENSGGGTGGWRCVERRLPYSRDFDPDRLVVDNYIPFHTLLIERALCDELSLKDGGAFDPSLPFFEDWEFLIRLAAVTPFHHRARVTCEYRHFRGAGHHVLGESPRRRADFLTMKARVLAEHADRLTPERLAAVVDDLRREAVEATEEAASSRRAAGEERRRHRQWAERFHALNGEVEVLRAEHERLSEDLRRLYDEERALRAVTEDQTEHLGRTYAEIARLEGIIRDMESTRAWRLYQRFRR
ncbi:MAG: PIG-L family deacetylase [Acidobacteriota bacterium]